MKTGTKTSIKEEKQEPKQEKKKINPVVEYFQQFKGTLIINDPALRLQR